MSARLATLLFGLGSAFYACGLFPDLGGLSGNDAAADAAADVAIGDASNDAGANCDGTFCDDFDRGPLGATWTDSRGLDAGLLSLGTPAVSPPNALVAVVPDDAGGGEGLLIEDLPKGSTVVCSVSIFGDAIPPASSFADILAFLHAGSGTFVDSDLIVALSQDGINFREDVDLLDGGCNCPAFETTASPISTGLFTRIELQTNFSTAQLSVNGTVVASHAVASDPPTAVRVSLGVRSYGTIGARVRFNDFVCTVIP